MNRVRVFSRSICVVLAVSALIACGGTQKSPTAPSISFIGCEEDPTHNPTILECTLRLGDADGNITFLTTTVVCPDGTKATPVNTAFDEPFGNPPLMIFHRFPEPSSSQPQPVQFGLLFYATDSTGLRSNEVQGYFTYVGRPGGVLYCG